MMYTLLDSLYALGDHTCRPIPHAFFCNATNTVEIYFDAKTGWVTYPLLMAKPTYRFASVMLDRFDTLEA